MEREYLVEWSVHVTASSPREAAELARDMQADRDSWAHVFDVLEDVEGSERVRVDLDEEDGNDAD